MKAAKAGKPLGSSGGQSGTASPKPVKSWSKVAATGSPKPNSQEQTRDTQPVERDARAKMLDVLSNLGVCTPPRAVGTPADPFRIQRLR